MPPNGRKSYSNSPLLRKGGLEPSHFLVGAILLPQKGGLEIFLLFHLNLQVNLQKVIDICITFISNKCETPRLALDSWNMNINNNLEVVELLYQIFSNAIFPKPPLHEDRQPTLQPSLFGGRSPRTLSLSLLIFSFLFTILDLTIVSH